jgi:hypothetical protein
MFEQLSSLKINFHKNEIFYFGKAKEEENLYTQLFGCELGSYLCQYLGLLMHYKKLNNKDRKNTGKIWEKKNSQPVRLRLSAKSVSQPAVFFSHRKPASQISPSKQAVSCWKGKILSVGGRLVLINSILSGLPMFMLSFFEIPKGVLKKLEYFRSWFFWQNGQHKKKYRLVRWPIICQPKEQGALASRTWKSKINVCSVNGCSSFWMKIVFDKNLLETSILKIRFHLKWLRNRGTLTSGWVLWGSVSDIRKIQGLEWLPNQVLGGSLARDRSFERGLSISIQYCPQEAVDGGWGSTIGTN